MFKVWQQVQQLLEAYNHYDDEPSEALRWLKQYTYEGLDKWPSPEVRKELLRDYPYKGGTLYRGMNFHDEAQYEEFLEQTKNGTELDIGSISSWTRHPGQARQFAVTRPTYFLNRELMQAEDRKDKEHDYMIGHAGVILKTTVGAGVGIDANKTKHGKEDEVILTPGVYKVEVYKTYLPYMKSINERNYKEEFLKLRSMYGKSDEDDERKFDHIMWRFKEKLDPEMQKHLWELMAPMFKDFKYVVQLDDRYNWEEFDNRKLDGSSKAKELVIDWNVPSEFFIFYELLLPADREKADQKVKQVITKIDREATELLKGLDFTQQRVTVRVGRGIQLAVKEGHIHPKFIDKLKKSAALEYHHLNSREELDRINKLSGPEQQRALQVYVKRVERTLKNLLLQH